MDEELACGGMRKRVEKTRQAMRLPVPPDGMGHKWHVHARGMRVAPPFSFSLSRGCSPRRLASAAAGVETGVPRVAMFSYYGLHDWFEPLLGFQVL